MWDGTRAALLVDADQFYDEHRIVPLEVTVDRVPPDIARLYFAWLERLGNSFDQEMEPWIPIGALGPILIFAHYAPENKAAPLPKWFSGRALIDKASYHRLLRGMSGSNTRPQTMFDTQYSSEILPGQQPIFNHDRDVIQFLLRFAILEKSHRAALNGGNSADSFPPGLKESVIFLRKQCAIVDLRYNKPPIELLGVAPISAARYSSVLFFKSRKSYFFASPHLPPETVCAEFTDHFRAECVGAPRFRPQFVLAPKEHIKELLGSGRRANEERTLEEEPTEQRDIFSGDIDLKLSIDRVKGIDPDRSETTETEIFEWLIGRAILEGANDIHVDVSGGKGRYRYMVDGDLRVVKTVPFSRHKVMVGIIRDVARMTNGIFEPESKRFRCRFGNRVVDFRVEATPFRDGVGPQFFTLRLLNNSTQRRLLKDLGLREQPLKDLYHFIGFTKGLILVTGPTGSGKSTTISCAIQELNVPSRKIVTVEDPVEQIIDGVDQVQVNEERGVTFSSVLRSFLRQAPNVIVIGEIRDEETAKIAVQAANTGHLVIATTHTNTACGAVNRCVDSFKVDPGVFADSLVGLHAQRLLRGLCPECKQDVPVTEELAALFEKHHITHNGVVCEPTLGKRSCPTCRGDGYHGRFAVMETIRVTEEFHSAVYQRSGERVLQEIAERNGATRLFRDALMRVAEGATTLEQARLTRSIID